jgi:Uma2 family endonuclease
MTNYAQKVWESPDAHRQIESLYQAMTDEKRRRNDFRAWVTPDVKAEFINGEVIVHSPVKRRHWKITDLFSRLLSVFAGIKKLGSVGTEKVMVALTRNDYEPDLVFFLKAKADTFTDDQMFFPAPDFVVEILSPKTAGRDKGIKKQDYAAHGVGEYWIIDPVRQQIEQYYLFLPHDKQYPPARVFTLDDEIESRIIPGFIIPVRAIFEEETNVATLQVLLTGQS